MSSDTHNSTIPQRDSDEPGPSAGLGPHGSGAVRPGTDFPPSASYSSGSRGAASLPNKAGGGGGGSRVAGGASSSDETRSDQKRRSSKLGGNRSARNSRSDRAEQSHLSDFVPRNLKRRLPEIFLGLGLMTLGGTLMLLFFGGAPSTVTVLALAEDVAKGQVITQQDLTQIELPADTAAATIDASQWPSVLGLQAQSNFGSGTVLAPQLLAAARDIPDGMVILGAPLSPGQYPVSNLRAGETVDLLEVISLAVGSESEPATGTRVLAEAVEVYDVVRFESDRGLFVSLLIDEAVQTKATAAVSDQRLYLTLTGTMDAPTPNLEVQP